MKYTETTTTRRRLSMPIGEFLATDELVRRQAEGEQPIDWLASQFLPDAEMAEEYRDWIARQAVQILQAALIEDAMRDGSHVCRKVSAMEFTPENRAWLFSALGHHPEVLATWRSMALDAIAA
jgi:hypothetical protein